MTPSRRISEGERQRILLRHIRGYGGQVRRAHGCVPTEERTQQRIVALDERPLIFT